MTSKIIKYIVIIFSITALYYAVDSTLKSRDALLNGICINAHPYSAMYIHSRYDTSVRYKVGGKFYTGHIVSEEKLFGVKDSCLIKVNPKYKEYISYSGECK